MDLHVFWFGMLGVLLTGYAILDGFDLGVGMLHLFAKTDTERRIFMNSIGPLWDGNEVWLVTFGGALFAAFPNAYATAFSAFYLPFMLLLFALIFRAVSMEFRGMRPSARWRKGWDTAFFAASGLATFLFGVAVGNSMIGLPIGPDMEFQGHFMHLLHPYALLVGVLAVATFLMHGSIFLYMKTDGELQARVKKWVWQTFWLFLAAFLITTAFTFAAIPHATDNFGRLPWAWIVVFLNVLAIANIPRAIHRGRPLDAFVSSSAAIAALTFLFGMALFPYLIYSRLDPEWGLTVYNASSSEKTLSIMRTIALIGMPFVAAYTVFVYWTFRGKVELGKHSY
jgi:cytochrome d ubiquinol oxidase subunit II